MNNEKGTVTPASANNPYTKNVVAGGGRKRKFNIVDFFLLLILAAVVAAVVLYFIPGAFNRLTATDETEITFVLEFRGVDEDFAANISVGDAVYDSSRNYLLGSVSEMVDVNIHTQFVYNVGKDGKVTSGMKEVPGLVDLQVTVTANAIYNYGSGYSVNGERIAVGRAYDISFPNFNGSAYCIELNSEAN